MIEEGNDHVEEAAKNWAQDLSYPVSDGTWDRISQQLSSEDLNATVKYYKWMSIAAVMVSVVAVLVAISPPRASEEVAIDLRQTTGIHIESLGDESSALYSVELVRTLSDAYSQLGKI